MQSVSGKVAVVAPRESIIGERLGINDPAQITAFFANGYFIAFYRDLDGYVYYKKSSNAIDWTLPALGNPAIGVDINQYYNYSIWYDGVYVNLVWGGVAIGSGVQFKRGTISGGEITWGTTYDAVTWPGQALNEPAICKTPDGYLWVTFWVTPPWTLWGVKSTTTDGSSWGTPVRVEPSLSAIHSSPIPLTNDTVYVVYWNPSGYLYGRTFDGTNIGARETIADTGTYGWFSAVHGLLGVIHVAFFDGTYVRWRRRVDSTWQTDVAVSAAYLCYHPVLMRAETNKIMLFYNDANLGKLYERHWLGGDSWSDATEIGTTHLNSYTPMSRSYSGLWAQLVWRYFVWIEFPGEPEQLKHHNFDTSIVPNAP